MYEEVLLKLRKIKKLLPNYDLQVREANSSQRFLMLTDFIQGKDPKKEEVCSKERAEARTVLSILEAKKEELNKLIKETRELLNSLIQRYRDELRKEPSDLIAVKERLETCLIRNISSDLTLEQQFQANIIDPVWNAQYQLRRPPSEIASPIPNQDALTLANQEIKDPLTLVASYLPLKDLKAFSETTRANNKLSNTVVQNDPVLKEKKAAKALYDVVKKLFQSGSTFAVKRKIQDVFLGESYDFREKMKRATRFGENWRLWQVLSSGLLMTAGVACAIALGFATAGGIWIGMAIGFAVHFIITELAVKAWACRDETIATDCLSGHDLHMFSSSASIQRNLTANPGSKHLFANVIPAHDLSNVSREDLLQGIMAISDTNTKKVILEACLDEKTNLGQRFAKKHTSWIDNAATYFGYGNWVKKREEESAEFYKNEIKAGIKAGG